jgi:hypothetical protein
MERNRVERPASPRKTLATALESGVPAFTYVL